MRSGTRSASHFGDLWRHTGVNRHLNDLAPVEPRPGVPPDSHRGAPFPLVTFVSYAKRLRLLTLSTLLKQDQLSKNKKVG